MLSLSSSHFTKKAPSFITMFSNKTSPNKTMTHKNLTVNSCTGYLNVTDHQKMILDQPLYGYVMPFLSVACIVANCLIIQVLIKRHMRTPTNSVLLVIAWADMFTVLIPLPWLLHMLTFENHPKPLSPVLACYSWDIMTGVMPGLLHSVSIWLTCELAVQRYIYACHSPSIRTWCTIPQVQKRIGFITFLAVCQHFPRFFEMVYEPHTISWGGQDGVPVCKEHFAYWLTHWMTVDSYLKIYYGIEVIFVHLIPSILMVVLNLLLFRALKKNHGNWKKLLKTRQKNGINRRNSYCLTLVLIVAATILFLATEVPISIIIIMELFQFEESSLCTILNYKVLDVISLSFFFAVFNQLNFVIYCGMSSEFRRTFKELFIKRGTVEVIKPKPILFRPLFE